ncbi:hypothetical protein BLOT_002869 [Blomia tropicalis]|nr:hypothetical protein BLOT_002869 [Blomia tropicalis]
MNECKFDAFHNRPHCGCIDSITHLILQHWCHSWRMCVTLDELSMKSQLTSTRYLRAYPCEFVLWVVRLNVVKRNSENLFNGYYQFYDIDAV